MIVISGESHLGAIRLGAPAHPDVAFWPLGAGKPVTSPFFVHDTQAHTVTTTAPRWRNRVFSKDTLTFDGSTALVALSLPLNTSRILRDYSWGTHVPWHMQKSPQEAALSNAVVAAILHQDYQYTIGFVSALLACGIKVVVIEGPHFFDDAPYLQRSRLDVCIYLDALYRKTVRKELAKLGVDVIAQRPETLTEQGLTKSDFDHEDPKDAHHANAKFGTMIFEDILAYGKDNGFL